MFRAHRYLPVALVAAGLFVATPVCAQTYGNRGNHNRDLQRRAYENGYREGVQEGRDDARRGRRPSVENHHEYRDADQGYRRGDGDPQTYHRSFRQGFQAGYRQAFDQVAGSYGRNVPRRAPNQYPDIYPAPRGGAYGAYGAAAETGYRDGLEAGRRDAQDGDAYDPVRSRQYRAADRGYDRRYGSKDQYEQQYRSAFQRGYQQGYR